MDCRLHWWSGCKTNSMAISNETRSKQIFSLLVVHHKFDYDSGTSKFWFRSNLLIFDKCIIDGNSNYKIEIITKDEYFSELNKTLEITKNNFTH